MAEGEMSPHQGSLLVAAWKSHLTSKHDDLPASRSGGQLPLDDPWQAHGLLPAKVSMPCLHPPPAAVGALSIVAVVIVVREMTVGTAGQMDTWLSASN